MMNSGNFASFHALYKEQLHVARTHKKGYFMIVAPSLPILALLNLGPIELIVIGVIGILLFGRRLPEIGKNLGKTIVEFKKGLNSAQEEINNASSSDANKTPSLPKPTPTVKRIAGTSEEP